MTIPYSLHVDTAYGIGNFYKILPVWHGSIYKMIWRDFVAYAFSYALISIVYRNIIIANPDFEQFAKLFNDVVLYFRANNSRIPIIFILSFFVAIINERWWAQIMLIPWPDPICLQISVLIHGQDRRGRMIRRTLARYINLTLMFGFELISEDVKLRFPTLDSYCDAGLILPHELAILKALQKNVNYPTWYIPLVWANNLIYRARAEGRIMHDIGRRNLILRIEKLRAQLLELLNYEVVPIPLAYTQVSTIAVYVYFAVALIGNQFVNDPKEIDIYVPILGFIEFLFFFGWLKIAQSMLNPFGDDDDDFELNWIIDRNIQVALLMVDEIHRAVPTSCRSYYHETVLRKPYFIAKKRKDGTYSNEIRPPKTESELQLKREEAEAEAMRKAQRPSTVSGLFQMYNEEEGETTLNMFEDMLTKSPVVTPTESEENLSVSSTESEGGESLHEKRRGSSLGRSSSLVIDDYQRKSISSESKLRFRRSSSTSSEKRASILSLDTLSSRRVSSDERRLSLEAAAPGTFQIDASALLEPDDFVPLKRPDDDGSRVVRRGISARNIAPVLPPVPEEPETEEPKPSKEEAEPHRATTAEEEAEKKEDKETK